MAAESPERAPGDITRGTEAANKPVRATGAGRNEESLEFARAQSFADPAHKDEGGLRTQETASEEGAGRIAGNEEE